MKLYLARHGNFFPENESDGSLTELGILQAQRLAERFIREGIKFKEFYSSDKIRARQTGRICCNLLGIEELITSHQLIEERNDEEDYEVVERMRNFIDGIKGEVGNNSCGIISHFYAIKHLLKSLSVPIDFCRLPHTGVVLLDYTGTNPLYARYSPNLHLEGIETW